MVEKKSNEIINRLNKTKVEEDPNFQQLREERDRKERSKQKRELQKMVRTFIYVLMSHLHMKLIESIHIYKPISA